MQATSATPIQIEATAARRATGAMFFAVFGGVWLAGWALNAHAGTPWLVAIAVLGLALLAAARRRRSRYAPALAHDQDTPERRRADRMFNLVNAGQWIAIFVLAFVLGRLGYGNWIIPMAIGVIGLHFLPLAHVFRNPPHYVTGGALLAWALVYPQFAAGGPAAPVGFLGAGLVLWLSAAFALRPPRM